MKDKYGEHISAWEKLIIMFADGRTVCNCGEAYYSPCGVGTDSLGKKHNDLLVCKNGCSANKIAARDEFAERVLNTLNGGIHGFNR